MRDNIDVSKGDLQRGPVFRTVDAGKHVESDSGVLGKGSQGSVYPYLGHVTWQEVRDDHISEQTTEIGLNDEERANLLRAWKTRKLDEDGVSTNDFFTSPEIRNAFKTGAPMYVTPKEGLKLTVVKRHFVNTGKTVIKQFWKKDECKREVHILEIVSDSSKKNIIKMLGNECGGTRGKPYIIFEMAQSNLSTYIEKHDYSSYIMKFAQQISNAILHIHGKNVVHRDVKPENILVKDQNFILADFGLSSVIGEKRTEKLLFHGTTRYMHPSLIQHLSCPPIDAKKATDDLLKNSDWWAFFLTLSWDIKLNKKPFDDTNDKDIRETPETLLKKLNRDQAFLWTAISRSVNVEELLKLEPIERMLLRESKKRSLSPSPSPPK